MLKSNSKLDGIPATNLAMNGIGKYFREKNDIATFFTFFIWVEFHIQQFLGLKFSKKLNHDILDVLNKPLVLDQCGFPLVNLHFELSVGLTCLNRILAMV